MATSARIHRQRVSLLCVLLSACDPAVGADAGEGPLAPCGAPAGQTLVHNQVVMGTLVDGCLLDDTYRAVGHPMTIATDVRMRFTLAGAGITAILLIKEPGGALVTGGSAVFGVPAVVETDLPAGSVVVWAATWAVAPPSSYTITATEVEALRVSARPPSPDGPSPRRHTDGTHRTEWPPLPWSHR